MENISKSYQGFYSVKNGSASESIQVSSVFCELFADFESGMTKGFVCHDTLTASILLPLAASDREVRKWRG